VYFEQKLENGLLMRTVKDERDVERYIAFNTKYNNVSEGLNSELLLHHFPGASFDDYQLIEDLQTGEIVSTTCLIPWEFDYEGIILRAAQLEQVLSHPDYRKHGLVRLQIKRFMQMVSERQFDLSYIWGIPYYYRQYGYAYCIDGSVFEALPTWRIPDADEGASEPYILKTSTVEHIPALEEIYERVISLLQFHATRSQAHWQFLLEKAKFPVRVVEDCRSGKIAGFIAAQKNAESSRITVVESGILNQDTSLAVLRALKKEIAGEIQVTWPQNNPLTRLARNFGSVTQTGCQWLFHITNLISFLTKITPVLERRLAASDCEGITRDVTINLFRQAYRLHIVSGKLARVEALGFVDASMGADGGDLCIPPEALVRLVFGYRGLEELRDAWPDIVIKPDSRRVIEVLFPKMDAYINTTYAYFK
jgi:hypothetical protein